MEHANELYKDWLGAFAAIGTPAIGRDMGCTASTVSCSVSRSIQFLQRYFKHDIETWNRPSNRT